MRVGAASHNQEGCRMKRDAVVFGIGAVVVVRTSGLFAAGRHISLCVFGPKKDI